MSAEEAIARAKAIAARLAGSGATASTTPHNNSNGPGSNGNGGGDQQQTFVSNNDVNSVAEAALAAAFGGGSGSSTADGGDGVSGKRKRWGGDSGSGMGGDSSIDNDDALAQAMNAKRLNSGGSVSKKVFIPVDRNPGYNYIGLLIGPGGSKQRELINQSGGNVKISIRGQGSSSSGNNETPGKPEEPLHVLLEGNQENVDNAEKLVSELLTNSEKAQAEKDRQLAVVSATKNADGSLSSSTYTPQPVAQLLGLNGGGHYGPVSGQEVIEEKIGIPNGFVGFIIGKGGESIASMQRKSGCRVQIQKEHEMEPGSTQRIITLTASTQEAISMCRGIIEEMVLERDRLNQEQGNRSGSHGPGSNAAGQAAQLQIALSQGHAHVTVTVPNNDVGLVIGKGGMTIRSIQERSGANVQIPSGPDANNPMIRTVNITHQQLEGADFAKTLIEEVLSNKFGNNQGGAYGGGGGSYGGGGQVAGGISVQVHIPDKDVGMCIGKSGCVIREMQQRTQTKIQIPSQPTPGSMHRVATVSGPAEGCQKIQEIISRIINEQSSQFVMNGQAFGEYGGQTQGYGMYGQQQQQPQQQQYGAAAGGEDYSAQWAAYYAAQATSQTAAAPAPASAGTTTGNAASQGETPAADAYHDAFFRYAYHYGEDAARQYYGAWSPAAGTANPYGVNPNGTTAAPAADGA